jgi:arginine utilization protein RocB
LIHKKDLMDTMYKLVAVPGISGTESENLTCDKIFEILSEIPYFLKNPLNLKKLEIEGDLLKRNFISALIKGRKDSKKTIIISGHFDVVGVEEYGHLKQFAFDPIQFTDRVSELTLNEEAKLDLASGDWIFGRGTADMKFGIALCIELLREYSKKVDLIGNILFLGVPGEETNSEGMIGALSHINELQNNYGFEFEALLLAECYMPNASNDLVRYIHYGACGKIMPMFFFAGKETHVSEPFDGINPNFLAGELNRLLELNTDFCEVNKGVITPPPMCLKLADLKELYSVQTPIYSAAYYNLITLKLKPEELIKKLMDLSLMAFNNALEIINIRKAQYDKLSRNKNSMLNVNAIVLTYDALYKRVKNIYGDEFDNYIDEKIEGWLMNKLEKQEISINIMKETYEKYPDKVPMIVIAFTPPYYPDRYPKGDKAEKLLEIVNETINYAKEIYKEEFEKKDYYLGICDMSYTGLENDEDIKKISSNMPGINKSYILPIDMLKGINIPAIVLGGYGKDFHKYTERLNISYSFNVVPNLYEYVINRILN